MTWNPFSMTVSLLAGTVCISPCNKGKLLLRLAFISLTQKRISHVKIKITFPPTPPWRNSSLPVGPGLILYRSFVIILRHTTFGKTPLDEWSVLRRDSTQRSQQTDHPSPPDGIRTRNPGKRAAADPRSWTARPTGTGYKVIKIKFKRISLPVVLYV
jgi:hypothetical protein